MNGIRINRVSQIVRLKHKMRMALNRRVCSVTSCALSPTSDQRPVFSTTYDSDEECCRCSASPPPDVPEGYLAVYVGRERKRFVVPTCYLIRPVFRALLQKAEEEFGFDHKGGLTIPCEINVFEHVLQLLGRNDGDMLTLDELVNCIYCDKSEDNSCSRGFPALRLGNP